MIVPVEQSQVRKQLHLFTSLTWRRRQSTGLQNLWSWV